jgi:hypothetical protein
LFARNLIKPLVAVIALGVITAIDLLSIDKDYLSEEHYSSADEITAKVLLPLPLRNKYYRTGILISGSSMPA